ncbi:MAG: hypothetical protein MJZ00_05160 [Paludibacteraceae bacterium]|nr:hypothetical protein [Paludibacteraceae bacterium]
MQLRWCVKIEIALAKVQKIKQGLPLVYQNVLIAMRKQGLPLEKEDRLAGCRMPPIATEARVKKSPHITTERLQV